MASKTVEDVLFPGIDVRVERVVDSSDALLVEAVATGRPGRCPACRKQARRVHSSYQRTLDERPLGSRPVVVRLRVRRCFCDRRSCSRRTFVEQVPGLSERHRRSSTGLTGWLRSIAVELGGLPAARLCRRLRVAAGRTRRLRLLTAPPVADRAPRVLGVDEFAFRKGCTYGTVLVDVEAGRVVDVLPDRTSKKVDDAVDAAGRHGVAVARLDEASGQRTEWIFDKKTFTFLGKRTVQVKGTSGDNGLIKPGMVVGTEAITERAIVNGMKQTPSHTG